MSSPDPKELTKAMEKLGQSAHVSDMSPERRREVEKKLKLKLDARCSIFVLMYIMNYLDRNNIAAARLKGLQEDLHIDDTEYSTCLSICEYISTVLRRNSVYSVLPQDRQCKGR